MSTVSRICANKKCGKSFAARSADVARGWARFCSKSCKAVAQEKRTGQYKNLLHRSSRPSIGIYDDGFDDVHPFSEEAFSGF